VAGGDAGALATTTLTTPQHRPLLVSRTGTFRRDDASARAALRLAIGLGEAGGDHVLVRTREEAVIPGRRRPGRGRCLRRRARTAAPVEPKPVAS